MLILILLPHVIVPLISRHQDVSLTAVEAHGEQCDDNNRDVDCFLSCTKMTDVS